MTLASVTLRLALGGRRAAAFKSRELHSLYRRSSERTAAMARMALPAAAPDVRAPARPKICQTYWPMADDAEDDLTPLKGVDAVVTWTTAAAHALSEEAEARIGAHRARQKGVWSAGLPNPNRKEREKIFEKVHMEANFLPASFLRRGAERARAVCRVETGTSYGSGVLLTPNIIMTNNHVLENARMASSSKARFNLENDPAEDDEPFTVDLLPDRLFITDVDLDFSIVACETVNDITPVRLLRNPATVATGERVNIIQHPQGRKKEVSGTVHPPLVCCIRLAARFRSVDQSSPVGMVGRRAAV
mmetsp:Transcript_25657/g.67300  ORF Transcript_25657/g.67300 Transcript_25657/m.67300 type:complete len:304 (+) Transcript_25657:132-1043(+)